MRKVWYLHAFVLWGILCIGVALASLNRDPGLEAQHTRYFESGGINASTRESNIRVNRRIWGLQITFINYHKTCKDPRFDARYPSQSDLSYDFLSLIRIVSPKRVSLFVSHRVNTDTVMDQGFGWLLEWADKCLGYSRPPACTDSRLLIYGIQICLMRLSNLTLLP